MCHSWAPPPTDMQPPSTHIWCGDGSSEVPWPLGPNLKLVGESAGGSFHRETIWSANTGLSLHGHPELYDAMLFAYCFTRQFSFLAWNLEKSTVINPRLQKSKKEKKNNIEVFAWAQRNFVWKQSVSELFKLGGQNRCGFCSSANMLAWHSICSLC